MPVLSVGPRVVEALVLRRDERPHRGAPRHTGQHVTLLLLAMVSMAAAVYAHLRLTDSTAGTYRSTTTRALLITIGTVLGYLGARAFQDSMLAMTAFALGFGVVHVPAACILLLKSLRGEGPLMKRGSFLPLHSLPVFHT